MQWQVSLEQFDDFAIQFWQEVKEAKVLLFHGVMGTGKTTIIAALCRAKGVLDAVSSPTFSIINEYQYTEYGVLKKLFHIDLYRLKSEAEVVQAGVEDAVYSGALCFVEWPEKAPHLFDKTSMHVIVKPISETERSITILTDAAFDNTAHAVPS